MMSIEPIDRTDKWRLLLVEDDDGLADSVSMVLTDAGYSLSTCSNGQDALAQLRADPPDLVILDLMMPVMNGWEFRAAQRADQAIANVPVVVISADQSPKATAVHADSYVRKPFQAHELLQEVERVLLERTRQAAVSRFEEAPRLTLLGQVAAGVGHNINNPLAFAIGNLEMIDETLCRFAEDIAVLQEAGQTATGTGVIASMEQRLASIHDLVRDSWTGADRVRLIVRNLQSLAQRADDHRQQQLDLRLILERSISAATTRIKRCARLIRDYHEDAAVWGSERRLTQLFVNLLINAADSIAPGHAEANTIRVAIEHAESSCIVEIDDSGSGMSNAVIGRIFEPFFTTKGREGGIGLGLAICRDIAGAHGGQIDVEPNRLGGSTFRVRLPVRPNTGPSEIQVGPRISTTSFRSAVAAIVPCPRIWVLDDERLVAKTVGRILGKAYDVLLLDGPGDALRRLEIGETFDALLCDLMMPEMSGMEVRHRIAALRPSLLPRIVFVSGGACTSEGREFAARLGLPLIDKPFDSNRLRAALNAVTELPHGANG